MKRFSIRIVVAILTFIIGVGLVSIWLINRRSDSESQTVAVQTPEINLSETEKPLEFRALLYADLTDGVSHLYESSDGVKISFTSKIFRSVTRARRELENKIRGAEIIERTPKIIKEQRVGERVVVILAADSSGQRRACIFWTYNDALIWIESTSLDHLLAFERRKKG
jgi:hypothetical protein